MNAKATIFRLTATATAAIAGAAALASASDSPAGAAVRSAAGPARSVQVQTFVARHAGWVRGVAVVADGRGPVSVTIRKLRHGAPTRIVVAAATSAALPRKHGEILLLTPPTVARGASYSISVAVPMGTRVWSASPVYGHGPVPPALRCALS